MIYLVEDDESIRELVIYALESIGLHARGFARPSDFWKAAQEEVPELVLLDIMLPEEDGLSILRKLREGSATKRVPVMMLTAKGSEYDKVIGLDSGADDYLPKPFGMMELTARVRALLRRADVKKEESWRIGEMHVSPARCEVEVSGQEVILTRKEFSLLCRLLEANGEVLSRDTLLNELWGYSFDGESRTVDVHIRTLRQKLGSAGEYIETVRGAGYKIRGME